MKTVSKMFFGLAAIAVASIFTSCDKERSGATGWAYNDEKNGGFERQDYVEQETGPGPGSYTHLRANETKANFVCRLLL